ncbi:hypothetical protein HHI36_019521 [Cryptolaemus montrouzieri]|uniref:Uncharacterized protein n=1 Tax=Cryptolaemus montrouzieri TaxID=559131 RepID=A0ABD2P3F8_9CUCU
MFSDSEEKKLDWMYKGPNALVDREDYLLGRTVDKTLEDLNEEDKNKATNQFLPPPKNHVEHECIPPSIRDYNKIVHSEQVDLQAKLQEDPLMLIKRQEDETRRQFLQNPIQLKKLQEAMQAQLKNKKSKNSESKIDKKLKKKLKLLNKQLEQKDGYKKLGLSTEKTSDEEILDTILMHKFNSLRSKLSEDDLKNILLGNFSDNEDATTDKEERNSYFKSLNLNKTNDTEKSDEHKNESSKRSELYKNEFLKATIKIEKIMIM